jgi:hypothetical protein
MESRLLRHVVTELDKRCESYALVHEAALMAYGLDNNVVPTAVDVLSPGVGERCIALPRQEVPLRVWDRIPGASLDPSDLIWSKAYGCNVLRPDLLLDSLDFSPDIDMLREQRAALAMVLYADAMSDDQLMEFDSHVRLL